MLSSAGIQRAMVRSMVTSWEVPHFGYSDEIVMDNLIQLRSELKDIAAAQGIKFSYLPIILKASDIPCSSLCVFV